MTSILLVENNGTIKPVKSKDLSKETLYKKCGFRSNEHFDRTATWAIEYNKEIVNIELWAKNEGKANNENKYDFPPPVDNALYYGTCALIRVDSKGFILDLSSDLWLRLYEKLFGGFEDIEDDEEEVEDDDEEEDEDDEDDVVKTKNGYVKDDFVVDDDEDDEEDCEGGDDDEDGVNVSVKNKKKTKVIEEEDDEEEDYYGSELEEEAYSYSDDE